MKEPREYLNSFYPLCCNSKGKKASKNFGLPKYIDGSCRREPDFENPFPCISALCRPKFAQKLDIGDTIVYVTNKKGVGSRKIIAVLEVIEIFKNHEDTADWYRKNSIPVPNNIMVNETIPFDLEKTHQKMGWEAWIAKANSLQRWNEEYSNRALSFPKVAQCKLIYRELHNPLDMPKIESGRKLIAQNPPILEEEEWKRIKCVIKIEGY